MALSRVLLSRRYKGVNDIGVVVKVSRKDEDLDERGAECLKGLADEAEGEDLRGS